MKWNCACTAKKTLSYAFLCLIYLQKWHHFCILLQAPIKITNHFSISFLSCLATLISRLLRTLKRKVNMRKELNDSMIICVKSISNFMCISSSVSHELCGHAKGQERNLSTLFGRTRRLLRQIILAATPDFTFLQNIYFCNLYEKMSSLVSGIVCFASKKHLFLRSGILSTLLNFDPKICCLSMNVAETPCQNIWTNGAWIPSHIFD